MVRSRTCRRRPASVCASSPSAPSWIFSSCASPFSASCPSCDAGPCRRCRCSTRCCCSSWTSPSRRLDQSVGCKARAVEGFERVVGRLIDGGRNAPGPCLWRRRSARDCAVSSRFRLLKVRRGHSERSLLGARAVTMSARMRRALAIALIIVLLVCPQRANGARNPEPTHEPAPSRRGAHPSHGSNSKPSLTRPSHPDAGPIQSQFIGKNVRGVEEPRRRRGGPRPVGWLDRTFDWLDGRVGRYSTGCRSDDRTTTRRPRRASGRRPSETTARSRPRTAAAARRGSRPRRSRRAVPRNSSSRSHSSSRIRPGRELGAGLSRNLRRRRRRRSRSPRRRR